MTAPTRPDFGPTAAGEARAIAADLIDEFLADAGAGCAWLRHDQKAALRALAADLRAGAGRPAHAAPLRPRMAKRQMTAPWE